jgi:nicotinamidase-related amidase
MDMLNDFLTGELRCDRARKIVPNLQRLLAGARGAGVPVVYSRDAHLPMDYEMRVWGEHAMAGTPGSEVIPELEPTEDDYEVTKRTYSAFHDTGMDQLLRGLGVDTLIITGVHTHICGLHTAADAFFHGYQLIVVSDGVSAFTAEDQEYGLSYLEKVYGARMVSTDELLAEWA